MLHSVEEGCSVLQSVEKGCSMLQTVALCLRAL